MSIQLELCHRVNVIGVDECEHSFPAGYAAGIVALYPGVALHVLRGWHL